MRLLIFIAVLNLFRYVFPATGTYVINDSSYYTYLPAISSRNGKLFAENEIFTPRGVNYVRLNASQGSQTPPSPVYHSTFSPKFYEGNRTDTQKVFQKLQSLKYNIVRVFIDTGSTTRFDGINGNGTDNAPLSVKYLDNVADFIKISSKYGIYVVPTLDVFPQNNYFFAKCNTAQATDIEFPNLQYMSQDCVNAKAQYVKLFLDGLKDRVGVAILSTIAWISITNEAFYSTDFKPFSSMSMNVTTSSNNKTYDMSNPISRQMCANENSLNYVNTIKSYVGKKYENVLITIGVFTFFAVGKTVNRNYGLLPLANKMKHNRTDNRFPFLPTVLLSDESKLDLLDVHVYHTPEWVMSEDLKSVEWESIDFTRNCVVMGEFGAFRTNPSVFPTPRDAAISMKNQQIESCKTFSFSGWLFWTWDTFEQPRLWNMESNHYIQDILSPLNRPSACK
jgi:hypothetical protein